MKERFHWERVIFIDFWTKNGDIVEIAVNPRFCTNGIYETLVNQGFPVRWMTEDELNTEDIFEIEVETIP